MKHILNIKNEYSYDVVVCGGGFTGVAAAIAASKSGQKVALIEAFGSLGGVGTIGNVHTILGGIASPEDRSSYSFVVGGLHKKLYNDLRKVNKCVDVYKIDKVKNPHAHWLFNMIAFDDEYMKILLDDYIKENDIDLFYFTNVIDTYVEDRNIKQVICSSKSGISAFNAGVYIDCTGDADIAYMSNCEMIIGREEDGLMAPASLIMIADNVNTEEYVNYVYDNKSPRFKAKIQELRDKGIWDFPYDILISFELNDKGKHMINTIRQVGVDGTNADSVTKGMIDGRKENLRLFNILKEHFPGYKNAKILKISSNMGIRETRRIVSNYKLTLDDLVDGKDFEDTICISSYGFDLPDPHKPSLQPLHGKRVKNGITQIPYRTMVPKDLNNLICPGRAICCDRDVLGPIRVMGPCIGMGEAAGFSSKMAIENNFNYTGIDISKLQNIIIDNNGIISENQICKVEE